MIVLHAAWLTEIECLALWAEDSDCRSVPSACADDVPRWLARGRARSHMTGAR